MVTFKPLKTDLDKLFEQVNEEKIQKKKVRLKISHEQAVNQPLKPFFSCSICFNVVSLDLIECSQCHKINCALCLTKWTRNQNSCPNCRENYSPSIIANRFVVESLNELKFKCSKCPLAFEYSASPTHRNECEFYKPTCPISECGKKGISSTDL